MRAEGQLPVGQHQPVPEGRRSQYFRRLEAGFPVYPFYFLERNCFQQVFPVPCEKDVSARHFRAAGRKPQ